MFHTIVVAFDGSAGSLPAFRKALRLARDYHSTLHVLSVEESVPHYASSQSEAGAEESEVASYFQNLHWRARQDAEAVGVEVSTRVLRGHAARSIAEAASEMGADLIVIGHHAHPGVVERLLGSTSDRVVDTAPCSVLVVRETESDK
jgi:nucleotide-binding universal stress UspA family protein